MEAFWDISNMMEDEITGYQARIQYIRNGCCVTVYKRISDPTVRQWKPNPFPTERPVYFQVKGNVTW